MTLFLLREREKNTRTLCSQCEHLKYDEENDVDKCDRMVRVECGDGVYIYTRLARFSRSGGECQLFVPKEVKE